MRRGAVPDVASNRNRGTNAPKLEDIVHTLTHLTTITAQVSAALPAAAQLNTTGAVAWVIKYIVPLILAAVGVSILARSNRGETSRNALTVGNAMLGIMVIAGGALLFAFGQSLVTLLLKS